MLTSKSPLTGVGEAYQLFSNSKKKRKKKKKKKKKQSYAVVNMVP